MNKTVAFFVAYLIGFLVTYGHAYNTRPKTARVAGTDIHYTVSPSMKATDSFVIAVVWPLYISTILWEAP